MGNLKFGNNAPLALYMGVSGATKAYYGTEAVFGGGSPVDYSTLYTTMEILTGGTINWTEIGSQTLGAELSYSLNDGDWTALPTGSTINVSAGDKVRFKGNNPTYSDTLNRNAGCTFSGSTAFFNLYGNIMSLIYGDNFEGQTSVSSEYTFKNIFFATSVVNAENLVLVKGTIRKYSYAQMFLNCASLITAPQLPSTTLADSCYENMFNSCTSLTTAPELPATTLANFCYRFMFSGCTSLTIAPELPATTLEKGCYQSMFQGCTSLTAAPELPAMQVKPLSYSNMFNGCTSLTAAPALPATTLDASCYAQMFNGCTSLTAAPALPATTLDASCYTQMFNGCTLLTTAPELPATTLTNYCYSSMFQGCTSLTTAPELPAMTLDNFCYRSMFRDCTSLTTAPELPAEALATSCYNSMFSGCTNLSYIKCLATDISAAECINGWLDGVSSSGTFEGYSSAGYPSGASGIPSGWNFVDLTPNYPQEYFTLEAFSSGEITYENTTTGFTADMSYSLNNSAWMPLTNGGSIAVSGRDKVRFKGINARLAESSLNRTRFGSSAIIDVYGNIMSLVSGDSFYDATIDTTSNRVFGSLFIDNKQLRKAENLVLPSNVGSFTYDSMFSGCSSLTVAPTLPATTLAESCYQHMFDGCTSLTNSPELPSTTLATSCYQQMFSGCSSLTVAPTLPATTLAESCYQHMFDGCTSLTNSPELPATTLTSYCYQSMFQGCTNLSYIKCLATDISATDCITNWLSDVAATGTFEGYSSAGYPSGASGIPSGWRFVDLAAPDYSQEYFTLEAFSSGEISYANTTTGFTTDMSYSLNNSAWTPLTNGGSIAVSGGDKVRFKGVNALLAESATQRTTFDSSAIIDVYGNIMSLISGDTFYDANIDTTSKRVFGYLFMDNKQLRNAENLVLPSNVGSFTYNGMFKNCSSLETAPKLPAMTMKTSCYNQMFLGCTSLTAAPALPATTLASSCYNSMFSGCTNLSSIKCLATNISASNCLKNWLAGVSSSGTFEGYSSVGYDSGASGIPNGWTFVEAT